ncbi:two-component system, response regulator YesN [Cohnella sp. OV330]|uniref:response regulator transcription factor n=1 Tax=Cohnella sp. OV330 TaxID=1855288 RepID=UPI0008ED6533|nr:response regulator [Cohnella sp. OV330]SFA79831.1 two-component system, response regulator YesN [Cohnella sp. OV330]
MHKLLIVDNEKIIVDGLVEYFLDLQEELNLDVFGAYSGKEAIRLLEKTKIDIVLSDIQMPGMSGLELQEETMRRWPRCKFVFLSGYDDFAYVQQAVRGGASNYILKTEGYEVITDAVQRVLEELKEAVRQDRFLSNAKSQLQQSLQLMQKEFMEDVLLGDQQSLRNLRSNFEQLSFKLNCDEPALLVIGRIDEWRDITAPSERALIKFAIQNIAEEFMAPLLRVYSFAYEPSRLVWLLQTKEEPDTSDAEENRKHALRFVQQTLADIQQACKELLKVSVSFAVGGTFGSWDRVSERFEALKLAFHLGLGMRKETIFLDAKSGEAVETAPRQEPQPKPVNGQIRMLQSMLENGERDEFVRLLAALLDEADEPGPYRDAVRLEIALSLAGMFLSAINRWALHEEICRSIDIGMLARLDVIHAWKASASYFYRLTEEVFDVKSNRKIDQEQDMITQIQNYVDDQLANDLSLTKIGEAFGHHPYYLSRLYKQITKVGLSEYIADTRLAKTKQLLKESELKVSDIAKEVGFISEAYFYRFFKKSTGLTPQEYRDA